MAGPLATLQGSALARLRGGVATTPGRIASGFAAVVLAVLLAAGVTLLSASSAEQTIRTIGRDAEPSVVLALRIGAVLADLDATATEDVLASGMSAAGTSRRWTADKAELDMLVVEASRNITYDAETAAVQGLLRWIGEYQAALAEVRGAADPGHPFIATQRLQWSHRVLRDFALPEADALAAANRRPLDDAYTAYRSYHWQDGTAAAAAVLPLLAILVVLQLFLVRRTRRLINAPLAAATLIGACLVVGLLVAGARERESVRTAKADCYDSLNALFVAKGVAAAMNANLSLWVLDAATRPAEERAFDADARMLLDLNWRDRTATSNFLTNLQAAQALERAGRPADAFAAVPAKSGLLGNGLSNITFGAAERDPTSDAVRNFLSFVAIADRMRQAAVTAVQPSEHEGTVAFKGVTQTLDRLAAGQVVTAVQLREREGTAAFEGLIQALDRTILVNQTEFDREISRARRLVGATPAVVCGGLVLAGLLAAAGLWQRYREYA